MKATQEMRAKLREELDQRFPFGGEGAATKTAADRYGVPAFLDPRHRNLDELDVSDTFIKSTLASLRKRMEQMLEPLRAELSLAYNKHVARQRGEEVRTEDPSPPQKEPRVEGQGRIDRSFKDMIRLKRQRGQHSSGAGGGGAQSGGAESGGAQAAAAPSRANDDGPQPATPDEVITRIIEDELLIYQRLPFVSESTDVLLWWRKQIHHLPVLSLVAASRLVIPASSGK